NLMKELDASIIHSYLSLALSYMAKDHIEFIVDDSDIIKPYGEKVESLGYVRDGSAKTPTYEKGYHMTAIVGISKTFKHPIPLITRLHSSIEKNYRSFNHMT